MLARSAQPLAGVFGGRSEVRSSRVDGGGIAAVSFVGGDAGGRGPGGRDAGAARRVLGAAALGAVAV
jgi:hypothetical protein